jgi:acyl-CoA thioester hydrolase
MGHMNVRFYAERFDEATWVLMASVGLTREHLSSRGTGLAALEQHITYKRELFPGDVFVIRSRFIEVRGKTMRFSHVLSLSDETLGAHAEFVGVHIDLDRRVSAPLPANVVAAIAATLNANQDAPSPDP